jgi:hypothetical protein
MLQMLRMMARVRFPPPSSLSLFVCCSKNNATLPTCVQAIDPELLDEEWQGKEFSPDAIPALCTSSAVAIELFALDGALRYRQLQQRVGAFVAADVDPLSAIVASAHQSADSVELNSKRAFWSAFGGSSDDGMSDSMTVDAASFPARAFGYKAVV